MGSKKSRDNFAIFTCLLTLLVGGCANVESGANYRPIVDGGDLSKYELDLSRCQLIARQRAYLNDETKTDAAIGAAFGALAGSDGNRESIIAGAILGGTIGTIEGSLKAREERKNIVINCMARRGYNTVESTFAFR